MLKDTQRQDIFINLAKNDSLSVTELVEQSHLSVPAVSNHLKLLTQSGIVVSKKIGTRRFFKLSLRDAVNNLSELVEILREIDISKSKK